MLKLSPNDSKYLADVFLVFMEDHYLKEGFVSKLSLCKKVEKSDNPSAYGRLLVDKLLSADVLRFDNNGRLFLDEDLCLELLEDSATFKTFNRLIDYTATVKID